MNNRTERIAELYFQSKTIKFGTFKLSVHKDHPEIPDSPFYMHYPLRGEEGSEYLQELYNHIGEQFKENRDAELPGSSPTKIAGLPKGAVPLANIFAKQYRADYPNNLLSFGKIQLPSGELKFSEPKGNYNNGDEIEPVEDHISGARNNRLFIAHARNLGFAVTRMHVVVDRQQGARENLAKIGVDLLEIMTADYLLGYGLAASHITQTQFDDTNAYRLENQFK